MQLKIQRSQRTTGLVSSKVAFALNARIQLSPQEQELVKKYRLGPMTVYDSETRKKHIDTVAETGRSVGLLRGIAARAMAALSLHVTIDSLISGQQIETKSLDELMAAEEAIHEACDTVKGYLEVAAKFDNREDVTEYPIAI
jgi:hypothetical protein